MTELAETRPGWHALRFTEDATKVAVTCLECGRPMWLPPSKAGMYRRCGPECSKAARMRARESRRRECATCGKGFYPRPLQLRMGHGRFCSQRCNVTAREALFSLAAQARAVARMAELRGFGLVRYRCGEDNPTWKGGRDAAKRRRAESGQRAADVRAYRKKNPHKVREFAQNRQRRKFGRLPKGTVSKIGEAQRWRCAICRASIKNGYHVDHITPLARGGKHAPANIQLLCEKCNVRKSSRDPIDYMRSLGMLI